MTFTRYIASGVAGMVMAVSAAADENSFGHYNQDAMDRHDAAMYQLVDELSDCAGYHSILMNRSRSASTGARTADEQRADFLALGADALVTLVPGPRSTRLLEMEARIVSSQKSLQNSFGSLGGVGDSELKAMEQMCDRLRTSRRRVFGWTRISNED